MNCEQCKSKHSGKYGSGRFCSSFCARSFATKKNRKQRNQKISKSSQRKKLIKKRCPVCTDDFEVAKQYRLQKTCSRKCSYKWRHNPANPNYEKNRLACSKGGRRSVESQKRRSKNEIYFFELVKSRFPDAINNVPMFEGWDADVIVPSLKIAIHWDGPWHRKKIVEEQNLRQIQKRDQIKRAKIEKLGYNNYTIKDESGASKDFVEKQFKIFLNHVGP